LFVAREGGRAKTKDEDVHVGRDVPGADPVDLHPFLAPLVRQRLGELAEGAFGGCVRRDGKAALSISRYQCGCG
jgi:hypothetical protein